MAYNEDVTSKQVRFNAFVLLLHCRSFLSSLPSSVHPPLARPPRAQVPSLRRSASVSSPVPCASDLNTTLCSLNVFQSLLLFPSYCSCVPPVSRQLAAFVAFGFRLPTENDQPTRQQTDGGTKKHYRDNSNEAGRVRTGNRKRRRMLMSPHAGCSARVLGMHILPTPPSRSH
jgi:hypothetical protein